MVRKVAVLDGEGGGGGGALLLHTQPLTRRTIVQSRSDTSMKRNWVSSRCSGASGAAIVLGAASGRLLGGWGL